LENLIAAYFEAQRMAIVAHQGKLYGIFPYVKHLQDVENVLKRFGFENNHAFRSAAWLHDFIEDTEGTYEDIVKACGTYVADLVLAVSDGSGNRKTRREGLFKRLEVFPTSIPLKLSDRIANVEWALLTNLSLLDMYLKEHEEFVRRIQPISCEFDCARMWEHLEYLRDVGSYALKFRC
jgi:(p)ppGpp synthase/HD superfamily hydrolase